MGIKPLAVVFDMDECTGSWQYGSLLYGIFQYLGVSQTRLAKEIYLRHIYPPSVRPGFDNCLRRLAVAKQQGRISDVVCYTANTGVGYPEFVRDCYEMASGTPGLFTGVFVVHRPGERGRDGGKSLHVLTKRLNKQYQYPFHNVIAFDDRPDAWSNDGSRDRVVKVSPFTGDPPVNIKNLVFDIVHGIGIQNMNQPFQLRQGDISFMVRHPQQPIIRRMSDLLQDLAHMGRHSTCRNDACCQRVITPATKKFIRQHHRQRPPINNTHDNKQGIQGNNPLVRARGSPNHQSRGHSGKQNRPRKNQVKRGRRNSGTPMLVMRR